MDPEAAGPASARDVQWTIGATTVEGTLVRPGGQGPFPAVVMVAGSGPTDRDWNSPLLPGAHGSGRLLASALADAGIASLRYDKRVIGRHARENLQALFANLSMASHREEVAGAVRLLAAQDFVRGEAIFALTNSEGALHALHHQLAPQGAPFAGLVLTAPPGRPVGVVARAQLAAQAAAVPDGELLMAAYDAAIARFLSGEPPSSQQAFPAPIQGILRSLNNPVNLPFSRELWTADASALLAALRVPVLVLIGRRDIQVDWEEDGGPLRTAASGLPDVTFAFPEHANHVLKHEPLPRQALTANDVASRYNDPSTRLDPEALEVILGWLAAHA